MTIAYVPGDAASSAASLEKSPAPGGATGQGAAPRPVAFMVMPFQEKETGRAEPGVPAKVDFDELWMRVYEPTLGELGFTPIRADRDVGASIIGEMIQRLTIADLVVADLTLPNAN